MKEVVQFNGIDAAIANACVHGILVLVSRLKKGRNSSFEGTITDGESSIQIEQLVS
jgi:hypothetical protein